MGFDLIPVNRIDSYSVDNIPWGAILLLLRDIAPDLVTEDNLRKLSFNDGHIFNEDWTLSISGKLEGFSEEMTEDYRVSEGEVPINVSRPIVELSKAFGAESCHQESTWSKDEILQLAYFLRNSGGIKVL